MDADVGPGILSGTIRPIDEVVIRVGIGSDSCAGLAIIERLWSNAGNIAIASRSVGQSVGIDGKVGGD